MKYYNQAANILVISKPMLIRWKVAKKIHPPKRDYLNHRAYIDQEIKIIKEVVVLEVLKKPFLKSN